MMDGAGASILDHEVPLMLAVTHACAVVLREPPTPAPPPPPGGASAAAHWLRRLPTSPPRLAQEPPPGAPLATPQSAGAPRPRHPPLALRPVCRRSLCPVRPGSGYEQSQQQLRARCPKPASASSSSPSEGTPSVAIMSAANPETPNSAVSREASTQPSSAATSQGYVLPEGKIMPNTVFVGGIDVRMDETEIRSFFARYGSVKEVKIITDRTGVSKGYGFVSFYNDVDVQKIVESQINFHGKKLKLGPAIRKQNLCAYHVQPRPLVFNPPPPPQFQSVWSNPNTETYMQPPTMMNPITQYVQAYPPYPSSPVQVITGYQLPVYNYQMPPQWPAGEQRSYVIPPAYTTINYHCNEVDTGAEVLPSECSVHEATPSSGNGPQKKSVDRSIQTVVSCLFNPENRLRNSVVTQDDYFKDKRVHHFRRSRAVLKSV
ncbi:deleted in azoospermia-like [Oryx dammah]|uniref:deleted in azoospermia-like n=1 Tax=Oryx dammah TaxID=59534 RepID=UPI001A9B4717|nr:deleted in azoospermia-like [Oryx dammah]